MKTTASSTTKCVQCGKRIFKGEECYEVAKGGLAGAALNAVPGFWNTRIFCSQGCLNAYKVQTEVLRQVLLLVEQLKLFTRKA